MLAATESAAPEIAISEGSPNEVFAPAKAASALRSLDEAAQEIGRGSTERAKQQAELAAQLAENRLGMVSALFATLQLKNPSVAAHSLRVAMECSRWAATLKMPDKLRTQLEAAALLHDIGKIGVADAILQKPGRLTPEELAEIDDSRVSTRRILAAAGAPAEVLDGVEAAGAWFDGSHRTIKLTGEQTPFVARMISIVDAFDSMTTDQVYRSARSRDRALADLYQGSGTQFDPELVASYCEVHTQNQSELDEDIANRWLQAVVGKSASPWPVTPGLDAEQPADLTTNIFQNKLIENLRDAVVFVDRKRVITHWNTGAERLTGVGASAAIGKTFTPSLLDLSDDKGSLVTDAGCPLAETIQTGLQKLARYNLLGRNGQRTSVEFHTVPVENGVGSNLGAAVLMHDVTSQETLEVRCQELHLEVTKDPMTQVANRAEFDRMLSAFVDAHEATGLPCSLIMSDIDRFKSINDTFGHQAGDEAIMTFAKILKTMCRSGDLVARYGGEEFAILCADCNNATAAKRAETIRKKLSETPHSYLGGKNITASFGVTELQTGDTPETLLRRADRGLLQAKDQGRNQVVQLGDGMSEATTSKTSWFGKWFSGGLVGGSGRVIETRLVSNVPIELAVEKLKGFVADRDVKILKAGLNELRLLVEDRGGSHKGERPIEFLIDLQLSETHVERTNTQGFAAGKYVITNVDVSIRAKRDRDRRRGRAIERGRLMLGSLKSYLMAREDDSEPAPEAAQAAKV
ncbi:diguanylate cyclase domain-containing protein [Botrimarina hoheduenensis]|uniref:diguanylate cyclase n=1 Tax=Botrimarina hoheduenensis TaxID=2528000 RepID=A0A5C5VVY4_9BACT|nr:diguanylate cyclase [Botrimarina hoheduenensis]TWT42520.1 Response regulator PleD [Botrimarina hoheduenensis]